MLAVAKWLPKGPSKNTSLTQALFSGQRHLGPCGLDGRMGPKSPLGSLSNTGGLLKSSIHPVTGPAKPGVVKHSITRTSGRGTPRLLGPCMPGGHYQGKTVGSTTKVCQRLPSPMAPAYCTPSFFPHVQFLWACGRLVHGLVENLY